MPIEDHSATHALYCRLTNRDMPCGISEHLRWNEWKSHGWTDADLQLVIAYIHSMIAKGRRHTESFRLYNLLDKARFTDDLIDARALARKPRYAPDKAAVLRATGRTDEPEQRPARTAADVMRGNEELRKFIAFGKSL